MCDTEEIRKYAICSLSQRLMILHQLFLLHRKLRSLCNRKPSGQDAHTAMRNFTARRCCGGAQSGTRSSKIEG
ncbi:hypothetical protein RUMHYD_03852 [Blautia hydrogenotrophica DSM 10507]|uniref:Uncharacterized protein n=1 Tax=Blautia hydrogenotrophica (strain DSM 10507 / JCM 14656 / S5a33) TaxID=476272 RepID=C0CSI5_BLAHS|nr:hypothetical protein RUMHYD_03852 [Blautia hydrogenotrophica DSM 10507]